MATFLQNRLYTGSVCHIRIHPGVCVIRRIDPKRLQELEVPSGLVITPPVLDAICQKPFPGTCVETDSTRDAGEGGNGGTAQRTMWYQGGLIPPGTQPTGQRDHAREPAILVPLVIGNHLVDRGVIL
jgi:hypothetical protein